MLVKRLCKLCRFKNNLLESKQIWDEIDEKLWQIGYVICLAHRYNNKDLDGTSYYEADIKSIYSDCPLMHMEHIVLGQENVINEN